MGIGIININQGKRFEADFLEIWQSYWRKSGYQYKNSRYTLLRLRHNAFS